jgi:hypothetical protein
MYVYDVVVVDNRSKIGATREKEWRGIGNKKKVSEGYKRNGVVWIKKRELMEFVNGIVKRVIKRACRT